MYEKTQKKEFEACLKKAHQGDIASQYNVSSMYRFGQGVAKDDTQALAWCRKAAEQGYAQAQFKLGWMYMNAQGVAKDDMQALAWFRKAAEQGDAQAQYNLGVMYKDGRGVAKDDMQALAWFRKVAEQGHLWVVSTEAEQGEAGAQNALGMMYASNARGPSKDEALARHWYCKAAKQGYADAKNNLGNMYRDGQGIAKDEAHAVAWYREAAEQGFAVAQFNLGGMYVNGQGVAKNDAQAVAWFRKAAEQGDADAQAALKRLGASKLEVPPQGPPTLELKASGMPEETRAAMLKRIAESRAALKSPPLPQGVRIRTPSPISPQPQVGISNDSFNSAPTAQQISPLLVRTSPPSSPQTSRIRTPSPISPQAQGIVSTIMQDNARQLMTGDMAEQFNALQKLLEEQSQQLSHFKQTQSMMMERQLTQQDTVIAENRSEYSTNDVRIQQLEHLSQQQGKRNGAIEQELSELKAQQAVLWQEYEIAQAVKAEQQFIARSPCLLLCYLRLQTKLNEWFVGNQAALSGSVQMSRSQTATEQVVNSDTAVGLLTSGIEPCLNLLGDLLPSFPLPGASFFITKLQGLVSGHIDKKVQKKMSHISELMVSVTRMERLTEQLARRVAMHYKIGLEQLVEQSAGDVGEWSVKPVMAYLYQTDDGHPFEEEMLVQGMFETIKQGGLNDTQNKGIMAKILPGKMLDMWKKFKAILNKDATVILRSGGQCSIKLFLTEGIKVVGQSTTLNSFEKKKIAQLDQQHSGLVSQVDRLQKTGDIAGSARVTALEEQMRQMQAAHEAQLKQMQEQQEAFQRKLLAQMSGASLASARSPSPLPLASSASASTPVRRAPPPIAPKPALRKKSSSCIAQYAYNGEAEGSLKCFPNEQFIVLEKSNGDWWRVQRSSNQEEGYLPASYLAESEA